MEDNEKDQETISLTSSQLISEDERSFTKLPFATIRKGMNVIFQASISTSLSLFYIYGVNLISLGFIGLLRSTSMTGGIGLGFLCSNCCAYVLITSINQGVNVLAAQAHGANKHSLVSLSYHRGLFLNLVLLIPAFLVLGFTKHILMFFNIDEQTAGYAAEYIFYAAPSFIFYAVFDCTKSYLYALNIFNPILYIQTITTILHFLWAWLFISHFKMGPAGAGIAKSIFELSNMVLILCYIPISRTCTDTWVPFFQIKWRRSVINWNGMKSFMAIVIPMGALLFLDQASYEVFTMMAGQLGEDQLAVHVDIANTVTLYYSIPFGLSISVMTYVANAMGKGQPNAAKNFTYFGLILNVFATIIFVVLIVVLQDQWADLFTSKEEIKTLLLSVLKIYIMFIFVDGVQVILSGTLKGIGKQKEATLGLFVSLYIFAIPLIYYLTFMQDMKVSGIWYGFLGGVLALFTVYGMLLLTSDFKTQVKRIQESLVLSTP